MPVLTVMVWPPLPPLVPPASVAQPLSEKSGSLPPRQLGSPPVVLVVLAVVPVAVLVVPPVPLVVEPPPPPPLLLLAVEPPAPPDEVVAEVLAPPLLELLVVTSPVVTDALLAAACDAVPVEPLTLAVGGLVVAVPPVVAAVVPGPLLLAEVSPSLVLATLSEVEPPPPPSVPALQAVRHAARHEVSQRTLGRMCVTMVAQCLAAVLRSRNRHQKSSPTSRLGPPAAPCRKISTGAAGTTARFKHALRARC